MTRVAWITGGSAGIGLAIAQDLCAAGWLTVISARDFGPLKQACHDLRGSGGEADFVACDVANRKEVNEAAAVILERHGRIDLLVNNAGFNVPNRKWDDLVPEDFDAVVAANLTGTFNCIHAVLPAMRAQKAGLIVNVSSVAGRQVSLDGGVAYTVAKHGVHAMSRLLNQSELKNGIRTCVIAPAGVATRAHDWRGEEVKQYMLQPEDVARAVRFAVDAPPHSAIHEIELSWSPA